MYYELNQKIEKPQLWKYSPDRYVDGSPIDDSLQMQILGMIRRKMKSLCADVFTKLLWDKAFSRQADNTSNGVYMEANIVINFVYERNNMSELQA